MFLGLSVTILDCVHRSSGMEKGQLLESDGADPSTREVWGRVQEPLDSRVCEPGRNHSPGMFSQH